MVLYLHIWGPAFGLPSIDPACIAAVAYLVETVPQGEWKLIASPDAAGSPNGELPALEHNGVWVGGFNSIIRYLRKISNGKWDLDSRLSPSQKADCTAFSALLTTTGRQLIDLSLYVSWRNYTSKTRSAYTPISPWPIQYFTPPSHRNRAKLRTEHLGLSGLDVELQESPHTLKMKESMLPATQESLTAQLKKTEHPTRLKMDALIRSLLDPLKELVTTEKRRFIFSDDDISSLDCLLLGYLGLLLYPELPQSFLSDTLRRDEYTPLVTHIVSMRNLCFGPGAIQPKDAFSETVPQASSSSEAERNKTTDSGLLWHYTPPTSSDLITSILRSTFPTHLTPQPVSSTKAADPPAAIPDDPARGTRLLQLGTLATGGAIAAGAYFFTSALRSSDGEGIDIEIDNTKLEGLHSAVENENEKTPWKNEGVDNVQRLDDEIKTQSAQDILRSGFAGL